ncbi:hypothetical protein [uncultured Chryseobacterium sp.]|uniref:hypothetical protein n=1 Tax=uncultured Chryseobacterium sp. TaxID=259322 RepID=UPI0025EB6E3C|nr:hypothetical protein [uncultured Chryseobacterium sp.]
MISFYKNIGLYESLVLSMEMDPSDFTKSLRKITYKTNPTFLSLVPDNGIPTRFEYRGMVNQHNFRIKRRLHFFDFHVLHVLIKGKIAEENNKILVTVVFIPFFHHLFALLFVFLTSTLIGLDLMKENSNFIFAVLPFIVIMILYFKLKRSLKKDRYDFERELHFILRKNNRFKSIE